MKMQPPAAELRLSNVSGVCSTRDKSALVKRGERGGRGGETIMCHCAVTREPGRRDFAEQLQGPCEGYC